MTDLLITPLGGLGETGALNCLLYHTEDTAVLVDCGVTFPNEYLHPGVGLIIPDFDFLESYRDKLKAVVLTHGHEDHVGSLPFLLKRFRVPVYATEFTAGLVHGKLQEFQLTDHTVEVINFGQEFEIGDLRFDPIFVTHSIMDVAAFLIQTDTFRAFHLTDFKIDHGVYESGHMDLGRFKQMGTQGLDLLLMDSTNAPVPGWTDAESVVRANLIDVFSEIPGRAVVCLFSSNSYRLQSLIECARVHGRKVALTGRSTKEYVRVATEIGRLDFSGVDIYDVEDIHQFADHEVLVIVTGSQAEPRSVLFRISRDQFKPFKIRKGDTVLMSSKMIPGNEGRILDMINHLSMLGANVIGEEFPQRLHASGHAKQDELREVFRLTKPKYFMPIHGEYRHLLKHIDLAVGEGLPEENCQLAINGDTMRLCSQGLVFDDQSDSGRVYVSENPEFFISEVAIKRRRKMAWNGLVVVSAVFSDKPCPEISLTSEGLFGGDLEQQALEELYAHLLERFQGDGDQHLDHLQKFFKVEVRYFFKQHYALKPEVIVMIHQRSSDGI